MLGVILLAAALPTLPEAWAPFEQGQPERRTPEFLSFPYRTGKPWAPSKETYAWAEFAAGDKSVLVGGTDARAQGMGAGGSGFGHLALYAGKNVKLKPGTDFLGEIRFRVKDGGPWNESWKADRLVADPATKAFIWTRPWASCGTNGVFRYTVKADGPGRVVAEWDVGVDAAAWSACRLGRRIDMYLVMPKDRPAALSVSPGVYELNAADPTRHVTVSMTPNGPTGRVEIDLHESISRVHPSLPPTGGFDFWGTDAYDVPPKPGRNLIMNGGFEQGFKGWRFSRGAPLEAVTNHPGERFTKLVPEAKFGRAALLVDVKKAKGDRPAFISAPLALEPGRTYTASVWCRSDRKGGGGVALSPLPEGDMVKQRFPAGLKQETCFSANADWERHAVTFIASEQGTRIHLWPWGGPVWIDGVMVEEGTVPTETCGDPVEACLVTSDEFNHLHCGTPINARLELTGLAHLAGTVTVCVENFYHERLFCKPCSFSLDAQGRGEVAVPELDAAALGTGIFILRLDYATAAGAWRDYARFTVLKPFAEKPPLAGFFAHFPWFANGGAYKFTLSGEFTELMGGRMRDWCVGATSWQSNREYARGHWEPYFKKFGIVNKHHILATDLRDRYPERFGWGKPGLSVFTNATPEEISFIESEAYRSAKEADPSDRYWTFSNEEELWQPLVKIHRDFDTYFKYQHACYRGLKRGFDERGLTFYFAPTHGTSAYCHPSSYAVMDGYLEAAARQNFRYTCISVHTYHAVDGSILGAGDRDAGASHLLERLAFYGYPESTPILFPEGYNVLPMYIPDWGAKDWSDVYHGTIPSQALGNREMVHAGALARIYVMDLKRYPRLKVNHTWQTRPIMDMAFTPYMFPMVMNTLGHLLPDPRFVGEARPYADVRGYCFRPSPDAKDCVLAVWTTNNDVENGLRKGDVLGMELPVDATFIDLMGNARAARATGRVAAVPLTSAPLFIRSEDGEGLLAALRNATGGTAPQREKVRPPFEYVVEPVGAKIDWERIAVFPLTNGAKGRVTASAQIVRRGESLLMRVETRGAANPTLDIAFDGLCDARDVNLKGLGPDDCAYRVSGTSVVRTRETNTQFRDGGASGTVVTVDDVAREVKATLAEGVWEIVFPRRFIAPIRPEAGVRFGLNLFVCSPEGEASSGVHDQPSTWPALSFR